MNEEWFRLKTCMSLNDLKLFQLQSVKKLSEDKKKEKKVHLLSAGNKLFPEGNVSPTTSWDQRLVRFFLISPEMSAVFTTQKIQKQNRSEIPSSNPLLPPSNYSLPADKLQVCGVCLRLLRYNRWSTACVCWAGCQSLNGSASQVHFTLVQQTHFGSKGGTVLFSFFFFKCTAQKISQEGRYYLCTTENS